MSGTLIETDSGDLLLTDGGSLLLADTVAALPLPAAPTIGTAGDFLLRLKSLLPRRWFPTTAVGAATASPVLDAVLSGFAAMFAQLYALVSFTTLQTRIATATGVFLDLVAQDFFGAALQRWASEGDTQYRARIKANLLLPRGTRAAVIQVLTTLTGRAPTILEPRQTGDVGAYAVPTRAYRTAGAYGSFAMPFQVFVTARRPLGQGIANVNGYRGGLGGYRVGAIEYGDVSLVAGQVTDAQIYAAAAATEPCAVTLWTQITN